MFLRIARNPVLPLLILLLAGYLPSSFAWAQEETAKPAALVVSGEGFSLRAFRSGALAWRNRTYVWEGVPNALEGWQYTQLAGGERATLTVFAPQSGNVTIATGLKPEALPGWQKVQDATFTYSDRDHSSLSVYQLPLRAGETLSVPQSGWIGTIVLSPALQIGDAPAPQPPGVVVARSPKPATVYLGSPSLAILPGGDYLAAHDFFGPGTTYNRTQIFRSSDKGKTWIHQGEIAGAFWSTLFVHRGALYLMGQSRQGGTVVIRRSLDEGMHWTDPKDDQSGLLTQGQVFSNAPTPVVQHRGRLWRSMEMQTPGTTGAPNSAFMMSAPIEADLLVAASWTSSNLVNFPAGGPGSKWLEGNAVVAPSGQMVNILRVERNGGEKAAVVRISPDGTRATFDAPRDFVAFPGGSVKFTIRFDTQTSRYWSIVTPQRKPDALRNRLALISSANLRDWRVEQELFRHPDRKFHGFQYADWHFEGDDLIFLLRTAWDGSANFHDSNYITFHRIKSFRDANSRALN